MTDTKIWKPFGEIGVAFIIINRIQRVVLNVMGNSLLSGINEPNWIAQYV
jgi:hypothetical protein